MKIIAILFLTAMVAIAKEKAVAEYLLVEVDSSEEKGIFNLFYYLKLYHLKMTKN